MPSLNNESSLHRRLLANDPPAPEDPRRNPSGIYSGMTKRLAITDGTFCDAQNLPSNTRKSGRRK